MVESGQELPCWLQGKYLLSQKPDLTPCGYHARAKLATHAFQLRGVTMRVGQRRVAKALGVGVSLVALWGQAVCRLLPALSQRARRACRGERWLNLGDLDDSFAKGLRRFLPRIAPDGALESGAGIGP